MKKIFLITIIFIFTSGAAISAEKKCQGMKKLSKEYLACKSKSIKEGTVKQSKKITGGIKNIGSKIIRPFKKKN
tara:strand:+ start:80 stop:301 length:222 start_codon:yes stop_codon:yes gene_type:complete